MSRIDVVPAEKKNKFKVLVNFIQRGTDLSTAQTANTQAEQIHAKSPHFDLNLYTA
jgi:hypothetical protein